MSSSATITAALQALGLLVPDDAGDRPPVTRLDRVWSVEVLDRSGADDAAIHTGRLLTTLLLAGAYELDADDVDEIRAAEDVQAIAVGLPAEAEGPALVIGMPDREVLQDDIAAEARVLAAFIDDAGPGAQRDHITDTARAMQLALADPARCTGRAGLDRVWLHQANGGRGDGRTQLVEFIVRATWRPGTGATWATARAAVVEACELAGLVVLNAAGRPAEDVSDTHISGRALLRLAQLANARFVFDDDNRRLLIEQTFDLIQETT